MITPSPNPCFIRHRPVSQPRLRLFCFPYAGGNAFIYRSWGDQLPSHVELYSIEYPGRGTQLRQPAFTRLSAMIDFLYPGILPLLDKPFAFFGHSMGAMISFELARRLRKEQGLQPKGLFISGRRAPQIETDEPQTYDLPEDEFIDELRRLNGTPREVLEHPELLQLMLPILRVDFEFCQTYSYTPTAPLNCPIFVFGGLQDEDVPRNHLEAWRDQTTSALTLRMFPGDHFFLHANQSLLLRALSTDLYQLTQMQSSG
jgi:medium-chain acyl-[acyl-carrier-protein] hydrolase